MEESASQSQRHSDDQGACKRRKVLAPWRFQVGYVRLRFKAVDSNKADASASGESNDGPPIMQRRRKVLAPWRFQIGYTRPFTKASKLKSRFVDQTAFDPPLPPTPAKGPQTPARNEAVVTRESVKDTLREFQQIYRKLLDEEQAKPKQGWHATRLDLVAFKLFRDRSSGSIDGRKYLGSVPGVHVGDVFHLRVELCVVGLHRQHTLGVDWMKQGGETLAVSIVSYDHIASSKNNLEVLVYSGSTVAKNERNIDGGNLALVRSMETRAPVRVIHGYIKYQSDKFRENKTKKLATYIYCGLYMVEKCSRVKGSDNHRILTFRLTRIPGQPRLYINEILESRRPETFYNLYVEDIAQGQENVPISVVNAVDDERPMPFKYTTKIRFLLPCLPSPPRGCDCIDRCSDSKKCACAVKNGGEIPFNNRGDIVVAKPLVYECGPTCKCPPTCHNRVSQHGIKFRLQIFKTKSMGWGVRSPNFIPSGSFVCEYAGEVLEDEAAQKKMNDEYLFAIGNNYHDESLWEGLSMSIPALQKGPCVEDEMNFAVDAFEYGNVGRFINHSCTPNLYAQNLLYDHDNKSMPHIMFFASEDIPPLQELTYHYNYTIDQVHDSNGKIKKKICYCGSIECTGWLY